VLARFSSADGERLVGVEVFVELDGEAERTAEGAELGHADESQFGHAHAEIAETERDVIAAELSEEPGALGIGGEELDDGFEVDIGLAAVHAGDLREGGLGNRATLVRHVIRE